MSKSQWDVARKQVYERANGCCEYCRTCEVNTGQTMQIDHIDPDGGDEIDNLCLSCWNCNNHKRQAKTAPDPETNEEVPLFNPRTQNWQAHFEWIENGVLILGISVTGRATTLRLKMNRPMLVVARQRWVDSGHHPPD